MTKDIDQKNQEVNSTIKKEWMTPEIIDLDIESGTQNRVAGPSFPDGGPGFTDYTS